MVLTARELWWGVELPAVGPCPWEETDACSSWHEDMFVACGWSPSLIDELWLCCSHMIVSSILSYECYLAYSCLLISYGIYNKVILFLVCHWTHKYFISCVQLSESLVLVLLLYITTARRHPPATTAGATLTPAEAEAGSGTRPQLLYMMTRGNLGYWMY